VTRRPARGAAWSATPRSARRPLARPARGRHARIDSIARAERVRVWS